MNTTGKTADELLAMAEALEWAETLRWNDYDDLAHQLMMRGQELRAAAETAEKAQGEPVALGEVRENGVVWFGVNPHGWPLGTRFYTHPDPRVAPLEAQLAEARAECERLRADAERWQALLTVGRIRILGRAGFISERNGGGTETPNYRHFGAEFWTLHPDSPPSGFATQTLTEYADACRDAARGKP